MVILLCLLINAGFALQSAVEKDVAFWASRINDPKEENRSEAVLHIREHLIRSGKEAESGVYPLGLAVIDASEYVRINAARALQDARPDLIEKAVPFLLVCASGHLPPYRRVYAAGDSYHTCRQVLRDLPPGPFARGVAFGLTIDNELVVDPVIRHLGQAMAGNPDFSWGMRPEHYRADPLRTTLRDRLLEIVKRPIRIGSIEARYQTDARYIAEQLR